MTDFAQASTLLGVATTAVVYRVASAAVGFSVRWESEACLVAEG